MTSPIPPTNITVDELFANCELVCGSEGTLALKVYGRVFSRQEWWKTWQAEYEMRDIAEASQDFCYKWRMWECRELDKIYQPKVL